MFIVTFISSNFQWGITPLSDNFSEDNYFYVIKVFTGMRPGAGTRSRVSIVIAGEEMDTGVRELSDGVREVRKLILFIPFCLLKL